MNARPVVPVMPGTLDEAPFVVRHKGKETRFTSARKALAYAQPRRGATVHHITVATHVLEGADRMLVKSDKAKPAKGHFGTVCYGSTSRTLTHRAAHATVEVRIW